MSVIAPVSPRVGARAEVLHPAGQPVSYCGQSPCSVNP